MGAGHDALARLQRHGRQGEALEGLKPGPVQRVWTGCPRARREGHQIHRGVRPGLQHELSDPRRQPVNPGPLKGQLFDQEVGVLRQLRREVEGLDPEDVLQRQRRALRAVDACGGVHRVQAALEHLDAPARAKVGLVEQDDIGEGHLFPALLRGVQMLIHVVGVNQGHDAVEAEGFLHFVVDDEGLGHGSGVRQPGGLDQDIVEAVPSLEQLPEDADEVASDGAADAAVVHLEDLLVGVDDQLVVHADFAEFILDDRDAATVVFREDAVEKRGLSRAEKAGEDGDRNAWIHKCGGV